jgi:hypothetical protein
MPRDGSSIYHRPVGTDAVTDTTIESSKYNVNVADVEQDLNLPRPIIAGGTAATSADQALLNLSAEKARQTVVNWDSTFWVAGSFFAGASASGLAPVPGHAFAGIVYHSDTISPAAPTNTALVCEATDLTDPTSPNKYIRLMTAGVWGPWSITSGSAAIPGLFGDYIFDGGLTFPPDSGQIRFDNAAQNSTTEVFLSHVTTVGIDNTGVIPFAVKSGYEFYVQDKDEPAKFKMFTATADPVLSGGDYRITALFRGGGVDLVSGQRMLVGANSGASATTYAVRYDIAQTLTLDQRAQARANIDVLKKNYILNGGMQVSQENGNTAGTTSSYYPADQFNSGFANAGTCTIVRTGTTTPAGSTNRIRYQVIGADAVAAAGDFAEIVTRLEGLRMADLFFGQGSAKTITLRFGVSAPAGTYCVTFINGAYNRSYVAEYVITAAEAHTDVVKTVTVPGDTTGTWPRDHNTAMEVRWGLMAGATYQQAAGTWGTTNAVGSPNQYNFMSIGGNTFDLFDVGLHEGSTAPPFVLPEYVNELATCQRYWESTFPLGTQPASAGGAGVSGFLTAQSTSASAFVNMLIWSHKNFKRVVPTVTTYNPFNAGAGISSAGSGNFAAAIYSNGPGYAALRETAGGTAVGAALTLHAKADARLP